MRARLLLVLLIFAVFAVGHTSLLAQGAPPAGQTAPRMPGMGAPNPALEQPTGAQVDPTAAVITIEGLCDNPSASPCQTKVNKADFEKLMHALDPNMPPQSRPGLADQYSKVLIVYALAHKENLENQPRSQEVLRFLRMQVLANLYTQKLQEEAKQVPPAEVEKYYNDHKTDFDEATLRRIYIPKNAPPDSATKPSDAEIAALATDLDKRAKAGEDFGKLQQEAYDKFGIKNPPPPTDMGAQRRSSMPPDEASTIFALAPNQVSDVINNQIGNFIYKVVSKRTLTLDEARTEIQATLQRQRYTDDLTKVFAPVNVKLNPEYFGPNASVSLPGKTPPPAMPAAPRPSGTPSKPPAK